MYDVIYLGPIPLHWLLISLCAIACTLLAALVGRKRQLPATAGVLHAVLTAALGLFIGRAIYSAVCWYDLFLDAMGKFQGVAAFFDPTIGSVNVMGFVAGLLLAAPIAARITKVQTASLLDASAIPALTMYILGRAVEPLTGQGYGDFMEQEIIVCWLEAALTALLLIVCIFFVMKKCCKPGTFFQYILTLWCLVQILPESLRCDEALFVFVFARVTHLGLAVTLGLTLIRLLVAGRKHLSVRAIVLDVLGLAAGLGLAIGSIFALDKTNWPKPLVYTMMIAALTWLGFVICRRIRKEDTQAC